MNESWGERRDDRADAVPAAAASNEAVDAATEIARLTALLAERNRRIAVLEGLVMEDDLTGLLNRRGLYDHLRRMIGVGERYGVGAALLYLDLDGFKSINDRHGHGIGDQVLVEVARRIRAAVRRSDLCGRLGGDEFLVILWRADPTTARAKADAIGAALSGTPADVDELSVAISASIGVAVIEPGDDADSVITRADRDMFRIKKANRPSRG